MKTRTINLKVGAAKGTYAGWRTAETLDEAVKLQGGNESAVVALYNAGAAVAWQADARNAEAVKTAKDLPAAVASHMTDWRYSPRTRKAKAPRKITVSKAARKDPKALMEALIAQGFEFEEV